MLTRITDWKMPCKYIYVYQKIKNSGPGPYNFLQHADNRKSFFGLSLMQNQREAHVLLKPQIKPQTTVQSDILRNYSSVRIGFNMVNKCHTLSIVYTMLGKIC